MPAASNLNPRGFSRAEIALNSVFQLANTAAPYFLVFAKLKVKTGAEFQHSVCGFISFYLGSLHYVHFYTDNRKLGVVFTGLGFRAAVRKGSH